MLRSLFPPGIQPCVQVLKLTTQSVDSRSVMQIAVAEGEGWFYFGVSSLKKRFFCWSCNLFNFSLVLPNKETGHKLKFSIWNRKIKPSKESEGGGWGGGAGGGGRVGTIPCFFPDTHLTCRLHYIGMTRHGRNSVCSHKELSSCKLQCSPLYSQGGCRVGRGSASVCILGKSKQCQTRKSSKFP